MRNPLPTWRRLLCRLGLHRWKPLKKPLGQRYRKCLHCPEERTDWRGRRSA